MVALTEMNGSDDVMTSTRLCNKNKQSNHNISLFLTEIFEKVSFDPYNFRITRVSARKSEQMKKF